MDAGPLNSPRLNTPVWNHIIWRSVSKEGLPSAAGMAPFVFMNLNR